MFLVLCALMPLGNPLALTPHARLHKKHGRSYPSPAPICLFVTVVDVVLELNLRYRSGTDSTGESIAVLHKQRIGLFQAWHLRYVR